MNGVNLPVWVHPLDSRKQTVLLTSDQLFTGLWRCCFKIAIRHQCLWPHLTLRPTRPGEHRWVTVNLVFTQRGRWPWKWQLCRPETSNDTLVPCALLSAECKTEPYVFVIPHLIDMECFSNFMMCICVRTYEKRLFYLLHWICFCK